ncbi:hypothetical protein GCM10007973_12630 [Polymorphobacter multimanifer]|uniref:Uncharacterized protein n=1 Tax=Polymorphobacter multimanifer TaxID=1070431 RepID=A0A841L7P7_9SPHN|nr:hypothetical protein [Polymorphobacter multimanifer]MBB6229029.1 hypothetical protein [Polymorphobacter multimanifer]GGI77197.1 hypothetical protein GCM10007973_12630 [Polymorphobacter multimanifer]
MNDDFDALKESWVALGSEDAVSEGQQLSRRAIRRVRIREIFEMVLTVVVSVYVAVRAAADPHPESIMLAAGIIGLLGWTSIHRYRQSRGRWRDTGAERMAFLEREMLFTRIDLRRALLSIAAIVPLFGLALLFGQRQAMMLGAANGIVEPVARLLDEPGGKAAALALLLLLLFHLVRSALVSRRALIHLRAMSDEYRREAERDRIGDVSRR